LDPVAFSTNYEASGVVRNYFTPRNPAAATAM
jgi:hypothetical protein